MINLDRVYYKYKNGFTALKEINMAIESGKVTVIVGKNGSGKSTLGNVIAKIFDIKDGNLIIDDLVVSKKTDNLVIRQKVGIVFQNPDNQIIFNRVYDDLLFTLKNLKLDENADSKIKDALSKVGMIDYINHNPYELSLGQKQRIAIANALAIHPCYIVFDEATAMLDDTGKNEIREIILDLSKQGIGVILITNIMDEILLGDKIVIIEKGLIKETISKVELFNKVDCFEKYGLNIPFKIKLIKTLLMKNKISNYSDSELLDIIGNL